MVREEHVFEVDEPFALAAFISATPPALRAADAGS
jgi:hypothetical protein